MTSRFSSTAFQRFGWLLIAGSLGGLLSRPLSGNMQDAVEGFCGSMLALGLWCLCLVYIGRKLKFARVKVRLAVVPSCQKCGWLEARLDLPDYRQQVTVHRCKHPENPHLERTEAWTNRLFETHKAPPPWCPLYQDV